MLISIKFSYKWNEYQNKSLIDYATFSQFLAGIGALFVILIAIFQDKIKHYFFEITNISIENNILNDKSYYYNDGSDCVRYFIHLKIKNRIHSIIINNCTIFLEPKNFNGTILDIPRPFIFAGTTLIEKNIYYKDFIDFAFINLSFINKNSVKLILRIINHQEIVIDLLKIPSNEFIIYAYSASFDSIPKFMVYINLDITKLEEFIKRLKLKREDYIKKNNGKANDIENIKEEFNFNEFYNYLDIKIERI